MHLQHAGYILLVPQVVILLLYLLGGLVDGQAVSFLSGLVLADQLCLLLE